jgi:hypothetical protein
MGRVLAGIAVAVFFTAHVIGMAAAAPPADRCTAPRPVCGARANVFHIASFDPVASAVLIAPGLLVTNRHVVADNPGAKVRLADGRTLKARVVPTAYSGDLILLRAEGLDGSPPLAMAMARTGGVVYTVGTDVGRQRPRVYAPGRVTFEPAPGKPLARLHHTAYSQPGNSGGALVDENGHLVALVTSGGEGLHEAIPASEIATLRALSGPEHADESGRLGTAYRACTEALERAAGGKPAGQPLLLEIETACTASNNRQFLDLAGQTFGRARRLDEAAALFERALDQDPHALNSRLGLVITLSFARHHADQVPHLDWLLGVLPADMRVLRMALQAGKWSGNRDLASRALALIEEHHPEGASRARQFLDDDRPPPRPPG